MRKANLFFDSSALFAGIASTTGAAHALLALAEAGLITLTVSEQVIAETERSLARKVPAALSAYRQALRCLGLRIVRDPAPGAVLAHRDWMTHLADVPILVAAMQAGVDYLVTLNRRHFIDDPAVAERSRLRIGMPGDALAWLREEGATSVASEDEPRGK
jgi:predicted nucleic acid-binding protein